ncbi:hypothetical protein Tco_1330317, partial [Tanacetum coccineum]
MSTFLSHSQASGHPVVITKSDGVGFHHGWTGQVPYGAIIILGLWNLAWGRRLLFSVPMLMITLCFCEVGWGGLGYLFWVGVIRECRVDYSYVMVMMLRVRWLVFSLFGKHSFLNSFYGLTWSHMFSMKNEGIRVMWIWSDKGHSFLPPLYDNRLISDSVWCWPSEWNDRFSEVTNVPVHVINQDSVDKAIWFNKKNEEVLFSVKEAWKVLRIDVPK